LENPDKWKQELERVEQLQEADEVVLPFGYDYIIAVLENLSETLTVNTLFSSGVELGRLIEIIKANKGKE